MNVAELDISVKANGLRPAAKSLEALGKAAATYRVDIAELEKTLKELSKAELPVLGQSITQFKSLAAAVDGLKGATTSFSKIALATDKMVANSSGLQAVATHLASIKDSVKAMSGVSLSGITSGTASGTSGGTSRQPVDKAAKEQATLVRQAERAALMSEAKYVKADYLDLIAAQKGATAAVAPFTARMREADKTLKDGGMSVRQYNAALRMVPAQFTDIATQLAGGQSPFLIALQQGGQLRDMFQGFGPMFKAVGGQLVKLLANPLVLVGAAVASLGYIFYSASSETTAFVKAVALSGGAAGQTAMTLGYASAQAKQYGVTTSEAASAASVLAGNGAVLGDNFAKTTATVVKFANVTGSDLKKALADYITVNEKASTQLETLDKKYNLLTPSLYAQITALEREGKAMEANKLANEALRQAQESMTAEVMKNLGSLERGWIAVKNVVKDTIDSIKSIGRTDAGSQLAKTTAEIAAKEREILSVKESGEDSGRKSLQFLQTELLNLRQKETSLQGQLNTEKATATAKQEQLAKDKELESGMKKVVGMMDKKASAAQAEASWESIKVGLQKESQYAAMSEIQWATLKKKYLEGELGLTREINKESDKGRKRAEAEEKARQAREMQLAGVRGTIDAQEEQIDLLVYYGTEAEKLSANEKNRFRWLHAATIEGISDEEKAHRLKMAHEYDKVVFAEGMVKLLNNQIVSETRLTDIKEQQKLSLETLNAGYAQEVAYQKMSTNEKAIAKSLFENEVAMQQKLLEIEKQRRDAKAAEGTPEYENYTLMMEETKSFYSQKATLLQQTHDLQFKELSLYDNMMVSLGNYRDGLGNMNSIIQGGFTSVLDSVSSSITSFAQGSKVSFKSMMVSVLQSVSAMIVKLLILKSVMALVGMASGGGAEASTSGLTGGEVGGSSVGEFAKGGSFTSSGVSKFASGGAFTNSVVSTTTPFAFASGGSFNSGIMGEAGPEAIMPLTRMANGNLGVETTGTSSGSSTTQNNVSVVVNVASDGNATTSTTGGSSQDMKKLGDMIGAKVKEVLVQEKRPGGILAMR